ncbi:hypothetical protein AAD018_012085 [Aestuariibius insulae]|uniref:hypothetical protein n=1 Tax=Aestuariibius insulae TaxID=2058287 RepID=UPI00345F0B53
MTGSINSHNGPTRRGILTAVAIGLAVAAAGIGLRGTHAAAHTATVSVTRMLGDLQVSEIGRGVQNIHRTLTTLVLERAHMLALIRARSSSLNLSRSS